MLQPFILLTFLFGMSTVIVALTLINYRLKSLLLNKEEEFQKQLEHEQHYRDIIKIYENKLDVMVQMDKVNQEALVQKDSLIQELETKLDVYVQEQAKLKEIKPKIRKPHRKPRASK